jgi:hypothetical protein
MTKDHRKLFKLAVLVQRAENNLARVSRLDHGAERSAMKYRILKSHITVKLATGLPAVDSSSLVPYYHVLTYVQHPRILAPGKLSGFGS